MTRVEASPPIESDPTTITLDYTPVDDLPSVTSLSVATEEDAQPDGFSIVLNLTDAEAGQVLAGYITRAPSKGVLYAQGPDGERVRIDGGFNSFDVGTPTVQQYVSRVLAVSSFWGSLPPYAGYHALGILGAPGIPKFETHISTRRFDWPWSATHASMPGQTAWRATSWASVRPTPRGWATLRSTQTSVAR